MTLLCTGPVNLFLVNPYVKASTLGLLLDALTRGHPAFGAALTRRKALFRIRTPHGKVRDNNHSVQPIVNVFPVQAQACCTSGHFEGFELPWLPVGTSSSMQCW